MKVLDRVEINLAIPGSVVRLASVTRHGTDCAKKHGISSLLACGHNKIYEAHMVHKWQVIPGQMVQFGNVSNLSETFDIHHLS